MAFLFLSKRSGQPAKGSGCIGCIPIPLGCLVLLALLSVSVACFLF